jgi:5-methylthioadenosine/S-adenosylhomocysteine deaminase
VARLAPEHGVMIHTHASENCEEIAMVERATGKRNIEYLREVGLAAPHVVLAHCIHLDDAEMEILRSTGAHVAHCPSSNLKLASGIARVAEMLDLGVSVSLGADGAPCNNRLDMFTEMRAAALLQKVLRGSRALPALTALRMATTGGARALGLSDQIGSVEAGKRADLQLINLDRLHTTPRPDPISTIVYAAEAGDVETVIIDGKIVMRDGDLITLKEHDVIADALSQSHQLNLRVSASTK